MSSEQASDSVASSRGSPPSSPRISPITRLRNARQVHEQLQERRWGEQSSAATNVVDAKSKSHMSTQRLKLPVNDPRYVNTQHRAAPMSIDLLATDLQTLWRNQQKLKGNQANDSLIKRIEKIGAHEKDTLIVHLLQQIAMLQTQRNDVVAVGEKLTTQLVQQQHDLRVQFKAQTSELREQLQQALHHHPEVTRLEEKIVQLQEANHECEQKLLFAVQKLHRSRHRERALRLENESDPLLWNL